MFRHKNKEMISEEKKKEIRGDEDEITDWGFFDLKEVEKKVGKERFKALNLFKKEKKLKKGVYQERILNEKEDNFSRS